MVLVVVVKSLKVLHLFCFGEIGLEKVFGAVLDRKQAILDESGLSSLV